MWNDINCTDPLGLGAGVRLFCCFYEFTYSMNQRIYKMSVPGKVCIKIECIPSLNAQTQGCVSSQELIG